MMFTTLFSLTAAFSALVSASPLFPKAIDPAEPFYLVTTTQRRATEHSADLKNVSLTTLFSPYYQSNYLLRDIAAGYESVPEFTLTNGVLHANDTGPHGIGEYEFNSTIVHAGSELQFLAQYEGKGDLSLKYGYLLAVNGSTWGWTICTEQLGQQVIEYQGTDASCKFTYIQAVTNVPY